MSQTTSAAGAVDYTTKIPNNVNLADDSRVLKALEQWHPGYIDWWMTMGPEGFQTSDVYLRTAISIDPKGCKFDYVKMPEYRWGILLAPQDGERQVNFGAHKGEKAWQEVPGEYRAMLRRLVVIQGDTEPASVEQQRFLGKTAPSLYDMRNLFQINVEEGRHLWAMVYLLQKYFGRDGREEAEGLLQRRSGDVDKPRMLGAFNEETPDWLSLFMFTFFTARAGGCGATFSAYGCTPRGSYRRRRGRIHLVAWDRRGTDLRDPRPTGWSAAAGSRRAPRHWREPSVVRGPGSSARFARARRPDPGAVRPGPGRGRGPEHHRAPDGTAAPSRGRAPTR